MREIGSEYWIQEYNNEDNNLDFLKIGTDQKLLMSGRSSMDYVLTDIETEQKIAYLPDYCCESMVKPFIDNNFKVEYYHVDIEKKKFIINYDKNISVFLIMNYFGFSEIDLDFYIRKVKESNPDLIIIEDITHRFMSNNNYSIYSDYLICSLRKWFPILSGGLAVKLNGYFKNIKLNTVDKNFINIKKNAMLLKGKYIKGKINDKSLFLKMFEESNKMLNDYSKYKIDDFSLEILKHIDIDRIKEKRIQNSLIIYSELCNNPKISFLFELKKGDVPLFVPIILNNRDDFRKKMIDKKIYLPVHWPKFNDEYNKIVDNEISLVCDQRYDREDIINYIKYILEVTK